MDKDRVIIKPFSLPGYTQGLDGTPLNNLQYYSLTDGNEIFNFIKEIRSMDHENPIGNLDIPLLVNKVKEISLRNSNLLSLADVKGCCSDSMHPESVKCSVRDSADGLSFTLQYAFKPKPLQMKPDFISGVIRFFNPFNMYEVYRLNKGLCLRFTVDNFSANIREMQIEFQTDNNALIGDPYIINMQNSSNIEVRIPLSDYGKYSEALSRLHNICFVVRKGSFLDREGVIDIDDFRLE